MSRTRVALIVSAAVAPGASNPMVREVGHKAVGFAISPRWFRNLARLLARSFPGLRRRGSPQ
jgi:hypothetical protein